MSNGKPKNAIEKEERPFVLINTAISADGKIALEDRAFVPMGSRRDHTHMLELRATADAVISGARTVNTGPVVMGVGGERFRRMRLRCGLSESHLRVIVSGSGTINPEAEIFRHRFSPIIILTGGRIKKDALKALRTVADEVHVCGEGGIDFGRALTWLRQKWGVNRLLCEGGGELNAALFEAGVVDEVHLTWCPVVLGGRHSPTLADGRGVGELSEAKGFSLHRLKKIGNEVFLVYSRK